MKTAAVRRESIVLALTVMVLLMPLLLLGLYVSQKHQWAQEQLNQLEPRYARLLGLRERADDLKSIEANVQNRLRQYVYPSGQEISQAGNDAQQRVRGVFSAAGLDVVSSQVRPPKVEQDFDRISISVRLEGELLGLQSALAVLPGMTPVVLVDGMSVQTIGLPKPDVPQRLAIQFNLSVLRARSL